MSEHRGSSLTLGACHIQNIEYDLSQFTGFTEQIRRVNWLYLIETAKNSQKKAQSYRSFQVGCAIWAANTHATSLRDCSKVFTGSNVKVAKDARPVCAEQFALGAVRSAGYDKVIAVVVVGEPQEDSASGLKSETLHPCEECRKTFRASTEFLPETIFLLITPNEEIDEEFTLSELISLHVGTPRMPTVSDDTGTETL